MTGASAPDVLRMMNALSNSSNETLDEALLVPKISPPEKNLKVRDVRNIHLSTCFTCKKITVWIGDNIVYPANGEAPSPNEDLPEAILIDYREASAILNTSPRGAAALIRLCIQKLCQHLDQPGENLNQDIASLVKAGLDVRVQRALDAVRVIGNNAVHPGEIDLNDDRATAASLFRLLNLIADKMISEPKHVDEVYSSLPQGALDAIQRRDAKN